MRAAGEHRAKYSKSFDTLLLENLREYIKFNYNKQKMLEYLNM